MLPDLSRKLLRVLKDKVDIQQETYLSSLSKLEAILPVLQKTDNAIKLFLNKFRKENRISIAKTLIAFCDLLFLVDADPIDREDTNNLFFYPKEHITEAVSFILNLESHIHEFNEIDGLSVFDEMFKSEEFAEILLQACKFKQIQEFEILVEHFDYACEYEGKNVLRIYDPSIAKEQAIKLGYISNTFIGDYTRGILIREKNEKLLSIAQVANIISENLNKGKYGVDIVAEKEVLTKPKYVIQLPQQLIDDINTEIFKSDNLTVEEHDYLVTLFGYQAFDVSNLDIPIEGTLTLKEFMKIRRFFLFLYFIFYKKVYEPNKNYLDIVIRSLVIILKEDSLYSFLKSLATEENIEIFLRVNCWDKKSSKTFDLQYHPFFSFANRYAVPLSIIANSSPIRNLYSSEQKRNTKTLVKDGTEDYLINSAKEDFLKAKFDVFTNVKCGKGEIDLIAVMGSYIFIAECKSSLLPSNSFELRTSYDYILKANEQLDYVTEFLAEQGQISLSGNTIKLSGFKIKTLIILNTRMFYHWTNSKHPVRAIDELANILNEGFLTSGENRFAVWNKSEFDIEDLNNYLEKDNIIYQLFHKSLKGKTQKFNLKELEINFSTYYLYIPTLDKNINLSLKEQA